MTFSEKTAAQKANEQLPKSRQREMVERFDEPAENYLLLNENNHNFLDKSGDFVPDTSGILDMYVVFTDKMIGVADGSISERDIYDSENPEASKEAPDEIIFLDKSGRPVSWLMDAFWDQFAKPDAKKPDYDFLNIDRVNWFMEQGYSRNDAESKLGGKDFDIDKVPAEDIDRIRALFVIGDLTEDNWMNEVWNLPTRLDGKNILVVDEVKNLGGTLDIALQLIKKAIPTSTVSGQYFWERGAKGVTTSEGQKQQMGSNPVWYSTEDPMGRGVGDISKAYYDREYEKNPSQDNLKTKLGWFALSAPHHNRTTFEPIDDKKAKTLQQDIAYLTYAVASGKVPRRPHSKRSEEDAARIIEEQGGFSGRELSLWSELSKVIKRSVSR